MSPNGKERESLNLKEAASLLTKGATLINDPCALCHGVQVKFKDRIICINCEHQESEFNRMLQKQEEKTQPQEHEQQQQQQHNKYKGTNLGSNSSSVSFKSKQDLHEEGKLQFAKYLIEEKITSIMEQINYEEDVDILKQKAELAEIFLELLRKIRGLDY